MLVNLLQKLKMLYLVTSFLSALVKELQAADIKLRQNATGTQRGKTSRDWFKHETCLGWLAGPVLNRFLEISASVIKPKEIIIFYLQLLWQWIENHFIKNNRVLNKCAIHSTDITYWKPFD